MPPRIKPKNFVAQASQPAEKLTFLSFRGALRAEESLFFLCLNQREIPRFARNDKITYFFRSLFRLWGLVLAWTNPHRLKPAPLFASIKVMSPKTCVSS
jgi:hypothetical protein